MAGKRRKYSVVKFVEKVVLPIMKEFERRYRYKPTLPVIELKITTHNKRECVRLEMLYGNEPARNTHMLDLGWVRHIGDDDHFHKCEFASMCTCSKAEIEENTIKI
ncbi:hypothetical protein A2533_02460 [Candidatus Falkowbacteria bacterium RIFOXYD2_FULL_35_9]|uniref:Uncharacterized protein n=1 Tax=Candidatus Falkowbacteria bacterium RIFOXYC2_FULL_36_12 TaxID=1798002 RepID=A0A1F5T4W9_9BACT|nr:MAG: hypothetical protein A2300_02020 [Candidatus Falkowbacteria bacterium RIFOXYB2_FULL_35_7]OGF33491.1 MAG: hypothetical protein A2478_02250 [Candidatus Falkowbacteria bacterium RIFOXYC2_FULL_36_12]OGF46839.1 MAG: hypothetical protein A2533_02460 [Candidatus Falkowbacteria bacterium RIFOXYD2_FULL_35_9]